MELFWRDPRPFAQGCSVCQWDPALAPPRSAPTPKPSVASFPWEGQVGETNTEQ